MKSLTPDLMVEDIARSVQFYRDVLGFEVEYESTAPDGKPSHVNMRFGQAGVMFDRLEWAPDVAKTPRGNGLSLYFDVGDVDIDAYYQRVREGGALISSEIKDEFWGDRHFAIRDPDGFHLSFGKKVREVSPEEINAAMSNFATPSQ